MSENIKPPVDNDPSAAPQRITLEPLVDEAGEIIPIERFLLSDEGAQVMEEFIMGLDGGHLTRYMAGELKKAARQADTQTTHPIAVMHRLGILQGLDDPSRQKLFAENPLIYRLENHKRRATHDGALDTPKLYGHIKIVMMNVIRYEALHGMYDPEDIIWPYLAEEFEYTKGFDYQLSHPMRMRPTTHFMPEQ